MNPALPWIFLSLVGGGLTLISLRSGDADAVATSLLDDENEARATRGGKGGVHSLEAARKRAWAVGAVVLSLGILLVNRGFTPKIALFAALGGAAGELYHRGKKERAQKLLGKKLEFFLPLAMERVVMAVTSGLDIIPALSEAARKNSDPVSDVFRKIVSLSESGLRVEHAIHSVTNEVPSSSVKHALVHLGLAYKQGGEVVRPLKELSDATQQQYQETVEEEIAKLPVKAVVPLVLTFTGLIVCFLTVPVMQISVSLEKFGHVGE